MTVSWKSEVTPKDIIQIGILLVAVSVTVGTMRTAIAANTKTLERLETVAQAHEWAISDIKSRLAERDGYQRGFDAGKDAK